MVGFEGALQQLAGDPTDASLRSGVIEAARTLSDTFNIASNSLDSAESGLQFDAQAGTNSVNTLSAELARVNLRLSRAADATSDQTTLMDQRDNLLQQISQYANIATTFNTDGSVDVRIGGTSGPQIVQGGTATAIAMTTAANGTISFAAGASAVTLTGGSLAGQALTLTKLDQIRTDLNTTAATVINTVNAAQTAGAALDGTNGQPLFNGTDAKTMSLAFSDGAKLATAPAGSAAGSRNPANLASLRTALSTADPAGKLNGIIFDISATVASRKITQSALQTIAGNAKVALEAQSGVDLDQEAANLMRYQQAFQACGKAMQTASAIFDTLLALK